MTNQFAVQYNDKTACSAVLFTDSDEPKVPANGRIAKLVYVKSDKNIANYSIDDQNRLLYKGAPIPDPVGFKHTLNYAEGISDEVKFGLTPYLVLVDGYASDAESTRLAWLRVKTALNLDPAIAAAIEQTAEAHGMTLSNG